MEMDSTTLDSLKDEKEVVCVQPSMEEENTYFEISYWLDGVAEIVVGVLGKRPSVVERDLQRRGNLQSQCLKETFSNSKNYPSVVIF